MVRNFHFQLSGQLSLTVRSDNTQDVSQDSEEAGSLHLLDFLCDNGRSSLLYTASGKRVVVRVVGFFGPLTFIVTLSR